MATQSVEKSVEPPETREVQLGVLERDELVTKKATCPFLGSAIATQRLPVRNEAGNPLASIQDVVMLGNKGGGDLGMVLGFFAKGNHGKMRGPTGELDTPVPSGLFSLDLPGSQGSHAGHSGILQDDPNQLDSGRFSNANFERLVDRSQFIKRSDIARFIAENITLDPNSESLPLKKWAKEVADLSTLAFKRLGDRNQDNSMENEIQQSIASIAGGNHLMASAGEFGLLLAFLHNSPRTRHDDNDPAFSITDITAMFKDKKFPEGWEEWEKTSRDWVLHTFKLACGAVAELVKMRVLRGRFGGLARTLGIS